ncbi:hypothetical protein [Caldinitratiruptor microaerophilus]|uniref:Uncharacterized protein n=1 Tax=Caldinitratiruptor microaerophilus TaxID=671077 RepID=A0AA35GA60_9FIRM|nr:hypothetical protein [Caldinitratiruptor microaerophilus]BDG62178.1 hypothetical protein caldi_32680 [Caldinitratiruptor microaerophilus]
MSMLFLVYVLIGIVASLYAWFEYVAHRNRKTLAGAIVLTTTTILLMLPESWIITLVLHAGLASSGAGAWLASAFHRPSPLAPVTYGGLLTIGIVLTIKGANLRRRRLVGKGSRHKKHR